MLRVAAPAAQPRSLASERGSAATCPNSTGCSRRRHRAGSACAGCERPGGCVLAWAARPVGASTDAWHRLDRGSRTRSDAWLLALLSHRVSRLRAQLVSLLRWPIDRGTERTPRPGERARAVGSVDGRHGAGTASSPKRSGRSLRAAVVAAGVAWSARSASARAARRRARRFGRVGARRCSRPARTGSRRARHRGVHRPRVAAHRPDCSPDSQSSTPRSTKVGCRTARCGR